MLCKPDGYWLAGHFSSHALFPSYWRSDLSRQAAKRMLAKLVSSDVKFNRRWIPICIEMTACEIE